MALINQKLKPSQKKEVYLAQKNKIDKNQYELFPFTQTRLIKLGFGWRPDSKQTH